MITVNDYLPEFISLRSRYDEDLPFLEDACDCCKSIRDENVGGYEKPICEACALALEHIEIHPEHMVRFLTPSDSMNSIAACRMRFMNTLNELITEYSRSGRKNSESLSRYFLSLIEDTEVSFETVLPLSRVAHLFEYSGHLKPHNIKIIIDNYAFNLICTGYIDSVRYNNILHETNTRI